ncbi:MAG TPA: M23 family metallopeptidase [Thermoanaerobaculia bacterium]|nr:M23 family metallopeptidase [Thermoanaerobaculia bacterium]
MSKRRKRLAALLLIATVAVATYIAANAGPAFRHPVVALRLITSDAPAALPVPVRGVKPAQLVNTWGAPRSGGRSHRGIDIFARRGTEIVSTTSGIVVTVGHSELGGRIVRVLGPGGYWHYYAHLERFGDMRPGDVIAAGTVIGYVGDSGNARGTPPHLHYGLYCFRGGAVNPYVFLRGSV